LTQASNELIGWLGIKITINPKRRLRQHNGELTNGAKTTAKKRPWDIVLTVYGFTCQSSALYFEWCWQHPKEAKRLRDVIPNLKNIGKHSLLKARIRFLYEMFQLPPWSKFPLTVNWVTDKYHSCLANCPALPSQIRCNIGPLDNLYLYHGDNEYESDQETIIPPMGEQPHPECAICENFILKEQRSVSCIYDCNMSAHLCCLSQWFLRGETDLLVPTTGDCPICQASINWADIIEKKKREDLRHR